MTHQPGALLNLETERFTLTSMTREDAKGEFSTWLADEDVMIGLNMPKRQFSSLQAVRFVLDFDNYHRFCLGIKNKKDQQLIGFFIVDCDHNQQCAETSVVMGEKSFWGKGVVIETRSVLLDYLFGSLNMFKVTGRPHSRNFSSIFNYKAMGFTCEAVLRQQMKTYNAEQRLDQLVFGILKQEWLERRQQQQ